MEPEGADAAAAASNRVGRTAVLRKECTLNSDGNVRMELPRTQESVRSKWGGNLPHCYAVADDTGKDLSTHVTSVTGSAPPYPSSSSMNDTEAEIVVKDYGDQNLIVSNNSHCSSRQGRFGFQYRSAIASRFKALHGGFVSNKNMQLATMTTWKQNLNHLFSREIYQKPGGISACLKAEGSNTLTPPTNALSVGTTQVKTSPTSNFSQLFLKKCLKGKGIINTEPETCPSSKNDLLYSGGLDWSADESLCNTISLREMLNSSSARREKAESLLLFRLILEFVDSAHSQGVVLQDLRASCFKVLSSDRVIYTGSSANFDLNRKRPLEEDMHSNSNLGAKQLKLNQDMQSLGFPSSCGSRAKLGSKICTYVTGPQDPSCAQSQPRNFSYRSTSVARLQPSPSATVELEKKWYASPEELSGRGFTFSSNVYDLGVLLFELLCCFESWEMHSKAMLDLHYRILPPNFLSENPQEAGFCLWLLHPEPSCRPTTREILQSDFICASQESVCLDDLSAFTSDDISETELLLHFLTTLEEQKMKHASKLADQISCLEEDIKEVEGGHLLRTLSDFSHIKTKLSDAKWFHDSQSSTRHFNSTVESYMNNGWLMRRNISKLEDAYFSMRSQINHTKTDDAACFGKDTLKKSDKWSEAQSETGELSTDQKPMKPLGAFFQGLCKFARYSKFEVCGAIRNGDLLNSPNVICSICLDRDEDFIAAAGISKKIKIFEFGAFMKDSIDIHYPVVEMSNKSKLSCVCWNNYIRNYLASTDYDGVVQMWDTGTGQGFCQYLEHQKRAWSVDFSQADPTRFASGSDDCSVKLWSINDRSSLGTIWSQANVCCLQFSAFSSHLLAFGSADYKVNCYDLRHVRTPLCTLSGHEKAISYVKFLDSRTLVSASTDNTLKLWDLDKTSSSGLSSNACCLTFSGHTNEKNFVGLSALDGYIACGSETNEVFCYYKSLPMPITSHKFGAVSEVVDDNGQFVSSVCWRRKSNMLVAANSAGSIELLQMV